MANRILPYGTRFHHDSNTSPTRGHPPRGRCRRDISQQTREQPRVVVDQRGMASVQIQEQILDKLVPLVVDEKC